MNFLHTIILGIVEGVTEFLPISSTFHLIIVSDLLKLTQDESLKLFQVAIQAGAILGVVRMYGISIWKDFKLMKMTLIAFIPTMIVGFLLYGAIKNIFFQTRLLNELVFILVGVIFIFFERKKIALKNIKTISELNPLQAVIIGLCQAVAVIPGVSRAGAVMISMMGMGFSRVESARFSFLLAVPTIFAASSFDLYKMRDVLLDSQDLINFIILGGFVAFLSAYISVKWLISYLQKNDLMIFGWWRVIIGLILIFLRH